MYGFGTYEDYLAEDYENVVKFVTTADMIKAKQDANLIEGLARLVAMAFGGRK